MPRRIDDNGLVLNLVKFNGRLELHFTPDNTFSAQYTLHGTDVDDTIDMGYARESAAGQPVVSLGLEMFVENAPGFLEVRFEGAIGSTLAFQYDGRTFEDPLTYPNNTTADLNAVLGGPIDAMETTSAQQPLAAKLFAEQGYQMTRSATRNAKVQTLPPVTKNVGVQTSRPSRKHAATQTKVPRKISAGVQTTNATEAGSQDNNLFPTFVDLTEQEERISAPENDTLEQTPAELGAAQTFTNAVATVFQTFNEPRNPYRQKRQAEAAADYRAYKHIFIEGYRNGDGKEEEGRLHVDLAHHVLIWESYDDYDGGAKLTLDRLDLPPRCESCRHCARVLLLTFSRRGHA
jgi:hypothetical protein